MESQYLNKNQSWVQITGATSDVQNVTAHNIAFAFINAGVTPAPDSPYFILKPYQIVPISLTGGQRLWARSESIVNTKLTWSVRPTA